jgi:hypothetical protein
MKTLNPLLVILVLTLLFFTSCRTEDDAFIDPPVEEALAANSVLADLLSRTSQNDGSFDNIIDNASCFSIQLPVTVIANGTEVIVNSDSDYEIIEDLFDIDNDDTDTLEISYPITVVFEDYSTAVVNTDSELLALAVQCPEENSNDDDIECIDFQYPITASIFNDNNDLIETLVINNDNELYEFVDDLDDFAAVTISFPITVIFPDGSTLTIDDIEQLALVIEDADDSCDEDDDNDFNDDDCDNCTTNELETVLINCDGWMVDELEINDEDLEDQFEGFVFNFSSDGIITVTEDGDTVTGTWSASGSGNSLEFVIDIPDLPDFNGIWILQELEQEFGETEIEFEKANDDELTFISQC